MKKICVKVEGSKICLANDVEVANNIISRLLGLMFRKKIDVGRAMLISPCNSIHTFFMQFSIDVIFLDDEFKIIKIIRSMRPWRMSWPYWKASQVLELPAGTVPPQLFEGLTVEVEHV
jgi:uncharacterized membrane protein (UPF0127 family)